MALNSIDQIKKNLTNKKIQIGSWITIGSPIVAEIMANAGFNWLVIDLEHSVINIEMAGDLIRIIDLCGVSPIVRLTGNDPAQIKRVMDAGAHGIIVPSVNTPDEALRAVSATRYAPAGSRGVGLARAQGYGANFEEYFKWQQNSPMVIVMIEHINAVNHLEKILAVPGVDAFIIGPYDLSCSLGAPGDFQNPLFIETIQYIKSTGERMGCPTGYHIVEPDLRMLEERIDQGYNLIAYSVDMRILDVGARAWVHRDGDLN